MALNPFHHLYMGERMSAREFTDIFSTELVQHAMPLFEPGHVVLIGTNGTGKTMLFKLLEPDVRLEYDRANRPFPVKGSAGRFVSAGINVNTARCNDFGNRRTATGEHAQELMFGDFLNYFVCGDLLRSIGSLATSETVAAELGLVWNDRTSADAVRLIVADPVWAGYLDGVTDAIELTERFADRLRRYQRFMNGNDERLDERVATSKTSVGEPVRRMVQHLRASGAVSPDLPFYIVIDQYEELASISSPDGRKADYRSVVNKLINDRDPTVSYRIGTRGYGWRNHLRIFGTDMRLEEERLFKKVDLEDRLRRSENAKSIFPDFARDVFQRRMEHAATKGETGAAIATLADVFGHSIAPSEEARILAGADPTARRGVIVVAQHWPATVSEGLKALAEQDPLAAKLGEAWIRQKGTPPALDKNDLPWDRKPYWKKERTEVAILQIAGRRRQRAILCGEEDILSLCGGNVLLFLSLCQLVWEAASQSSALPDKQPELPIRWEVQTVGIFRTARNWVNRISSEYGRSRDRLKLVEKLGERFADLLLSDLKMSNPGHNGFSILADELRDDDQVSEFLIECVDYGNLVMSEHANRSDRRRRYKFYLNPLYSPVFKIPFQRTKEPLYVPIAVFREWLGDAGILGIPRSTRTRSAPREDAPLLALIDPGE